MTTKRKCMRERLEEFKNGFSGEGMDPDVVKFRQQAAVIKREKELEMTPEPPDVEKILDEIRRNRGNRARRSD